LALLVAEPSNRGIGSWSALQFVFPRQLSVPSRVTRFGKFSPIGRLFTLESFLLKITKVDQILGYIFSRGINIDNDFLSIYFS
jgi:hypothetical protein